jgi:hypothetical protein
VIKALQVAYDLAFDPSLFGCAEVDPNPRKDGYVIFIHLTNGGKHDIKAKSTKEAYDKIAWLVDAINSAMSPSNPIATPGPFDAEVLMVQPSVVDPRFGESEEGVDVE